MGYLSLTHPTLSGTLLMKYRFAVILLCSASALSSTAKAGQTAASDNCQTVSGILNLSADDGAVLSQGKTEYQINTAPNKLYNISIKNLVEGVKGTYKICRTGAYDRFGLPVVNIAGFSNLTFNERD
jgi:hypothetical protein